jgi:hypothetical protein
MPPMTIIGCVRLMSISVSPPKFREIAGADHSIVVAAPYIIHARFELNQVIPVRPAVSGPFHVANDAAERKTTVRVCRSPTGRCAGNRRINPYPGQTSQMIMMLPWIYHVDGLIATLKPVLYEWKQHAVLFVVAVKKRTDVTYFAELGAGKGNWRRRSLHGRFLLLWTARETGTPSTWVAHG